MSQVNVEIVRRVYDAMNTRDLTAGAELMHAGAEWIPDSRVGVGPIRGRENVIRFMLDQAEMFEGTHLEIERFWEKDDKVLVYVHATGRGRGSGAPFEIRIAHLWTLRNGLVTRGEGYANRAEALEAVGLSEQDAHADS
jgi:ketosteroid isomerase-like protein